MKVMNISRIIMPFMRYGSLWEERTGIISDRIIRMVVIGISIRMWICGVHSLAWDFIRMAAYPI
jgi:hypothetical protein